VYGRLQATCSGPLAGVAVVVLNHFRTDELAA
jgi:hypothetical protein